MVSMTLGVRAFLTALCSSESCKVVRDSANWLEPTISFWKRSINEGLQCNAHLRRNCNMNCCDAVLTVLCSSDSVGCSSCCVVAMLCSSSGSANAGPSIAAATVS